MKDTRLSRNGAGMIVNAASVLRSGKMTDHFFKEKRSPDHIKWSESSRIGMVGSSGKESDRFWPNNVVKPTTLFSKSGQREIGVLTTSPLYLTMREGCVKKRENTYPPSLRNKPEMWREATENTCGLQAVTNENRREPHRSSLHAGQRQSSLREAASGAPLKGESENRE